MHYKLRAMQKMLTSVCNKSTLSHRPVFNKFRKIALCTDSPDKKLSAIDMEIKNIETIHSRVKSQNQSITSPKIKKIVNQVEKRITEGLVLYISAWRMLAEYNEAQKEKIDESSLNNDEINKENKMNVDEEEKINGNSLNDNEINQKDSPDMVVTEYFIEPEGASSYMNDCKIQELLNMAEEAELILMKAENLMVNSLNDHPLES